MAHVSDFFLILYPCVLSVVFNIPKVFSLLFLGQIIDIFVTLSHWHPKVNHWLNGKLLPGNVSQEALYKHLLSEDQLLLVPQPQLAE